MYGFILSLDRRSKEGIYAGMGKSSCTVVHLEKDMQVRVITIALLTQKNVTM